MTSLTSNPDLADTAVWTVQVHGTTPLHAYFGNDVMERSVVVMGMGSDVVVECVPTTKLPAAVSCGAQTLTFRDLTVRGCSESGFLYTTHGRVVLRNVRYVYVGVAQAVETRDAEGVACYAHSAVCVHWVRRGPGVAGTDESIETFWKLGVVLASGLWTTQRVANCCMHVWRHLRLCNSARLQSVMYTGSSDGCVRVLPWWSLACIVHRASQWSRFESGQQASGAAAPAVRLDASTLLVQVCDRSLQGS